MPPEQIIVGQPYTLSLECNAISGNTKARFSNVKCFYIFADDHIEHEIEMIPTGETVNRHVMFSCDLPAFSKAGKLKYYFRFKFDGQSASRYFPDVPVVVNK